MGDFGNYLRELRGKKSLREVSKGTGISHTYLSTLEKGYDPRTKKKRNPAPNTLKLLADYYEVSYNDLLVKAGYLEKDFISRLKGMLADARAEQPDKVDLERVFEYFLLDTPFYWGETRLEENQKFFINKAILTLTTSMIDTDQQMTNQDIEDLMEILKHFFIERGLDKHVWKWEH
ncbi:helix-turn-helix domain-containing protein [Halobacillus halophilus]|uniref:helix-turn-helix domain-containing protein n=1 Tax=Halobacillus halophilus TaxID=1570 RepID=UPI001CD4BB91|nr:helix-turn-helix transcriptional regulator [Halobacillus halophilus]MCA1011381.1 helix-turn-helix domain-containing protein [Halobacillus halophilus]